VGCLLADEDGIYDPRLPNDRLLLGMKGTMSEMELSLLRQRSLEALRQKARRGELFLRAAASFRGPPPGVREAEGPGRPSLPRSRRSLVGCRTRLAWIIHSGYEHAV